MDKSIESVKDFWEENPLFSGESKHEVGSRGFFEEHQQVYYDDVFAGQFPQDLVIPSLNEGDKALDLGCGVGFWVIEILNKNPNCEMYAADLTSKALEVTQKRLNSYGYSAQLSQQNAEKMDFADETFDHLNCQGVIHHTPDTEACVREIARVVKKGGTAYLSVYYRNFPIRNWALLRPFGKLIHLFGARFKGRGRDNIFLEKEINEITRLYDGDKNPIGKSYSKKEFTQMLEPYFDIEKVYLNFFPARALPIPVPKFIHRFLSKQMGFMIHVNLRKK